MNMLSQQNPQNIFQRERYVYVCVYIYLMCIYMYMTYINTHRWHKKKPHTDTPLTWAGISGLISSLATTPPLPALRLQLPGSGPLAPLQTHSLQGESVTVVYRVLSHMLLPVTTPKATFPYSRASIPSSTCLPQSTRASLCPPQGSRMRGEKTVVLYFQSAVTWSIQPLRPISEHTGGCCTSRTHPENRQLVDVWGGSQEGKGGGVL